MRPLKAKSVTSSEEQPIKKQKTLPEKGSVDKDEVAIDAFVNGLSPAQVRALSEDWSLLARPEQLPPKGDWLTWLLLGGRGAGKTRAGAEWVHDLATGGQDFNSNVGCSRIALVAETLSDAREIMVDGDSGILNIARRNRPSFEASRRRLVWPNGAIAHIFSSEDPESLRGPQFDAAWCDELCKWHYAQETWDMLQFGLRLGERPRQLITTTPKASQLLKKIMSFDETSIVRMRTSDNEENLASSFISNVQARYAGTRLGRQELEGEILEDREGALWSRAQLDALRIELMPDMQRIVVAIDPPASASAKGSCCGLVVAGIDVDGKAVVLKDGSIDGASPSQWSQAAVRLYHAFEADLIVAEINQGGDMVKSVLRACDEKVPIHTVRATRGKWLRAEPVAALYERKMVAHLGALEELEDQMCNYAPLEGADIGSPDRLDALVWAITALCLDKGGAPLIRAI